jgi:hypothetical protein
MNKRPIIFFFKKEGDPNLVSNWDFWVKRRWCSFLPDLLEDFPRLSTSSGATASEDRFRLGVSLAVLGWICIMLFEGGGAFLPKRTTGATGKKQKGDPSSFIGSGPFSCCRNKE